MSQPGIGQDALAADDLPPLPLERLRHWQRNAPDQVFLRQPVDGAVRELGWAQVAGQVRTLALRLHDLGLQPGDRLAVLSKNCAEWFITDLALMMGGFISVPIFATANAETISYILEHSAARALFVGKLDDWHKLQHGIPRDIPRIAFPYETLPAEHTWAELLAGDPADRDLPEPRPEDLMSIVYTSGSTGRPKGVMLSHGAYAFACEQVSRTCQVTSRDRAISYLPLAHITERVYIQGAFLYGGGQVSFVESLDTFAATLQEVSPTMFLSVPRLWTRFQMAVQDKVPAARLRRLLRIPLLNRLVKRRIRRGLGLDDARLLGSGTAPIAPSILNWYRELGLNISEGWGMTESAGYGTMSLPFDAAKLGTVGRPGSGVELRISDEGEVLLRSPALMQGYYLDPEKTAEAMVDGWLRTGDKGSLDEDGYLRLTGRLKDIFKTGKGKYVAPVPIESLFLANPLIEQVCIVGAGMPQPVAVVVLSEAAERESRAELISALDNTRRQVNERLMPHERIASLLVARDEWTSDNGLLTPTLKLKRHLLEERYGALAGWADSDTVVWEAP